MQAVLYAKRDNLNGYTSNLVFHLVHFYATGGQKKEEGPEFSFAGDVTFKKLLSGILQPLFFIFHISLLSGLVCITLSCNYTV